MKKNLLILRHAKSSHADPGQSDEQRPLNSRGLAAAPRIGQLIKDEELVPDLILSSSAVRARQTAELVARACGYEGAIDFRPSLYLAPPESYVQALASLTDDPRIVLVVGHNPGLEEWQAMLTGEFHAFPTGGLARVTLPMERWSEFAISTVGKLKSFWAPRELD